MDNLDKAFITYLVIVAAVMLLAVFCVRMLIEDVDSHITDAEENIGKMVVINGDSLFVFDYNFFGDTYVLSNGLEVNAKLVEDAR